MIQNLTIKQMVTNFFVVYKNDLPGATNVNANQENEVIKLSALAWLTENCGKVYQEITSNENLNADLIDIFAQTFVRHFWNTEIGYDSPLDFFVHLRGFLDENLPVWAQFYKEAIIKKGLYQTSTGSVTVEDNGTLHFEGNSTSDNTSNTAGKTSNDGKNSTQTKTDGTNSSDQDSNSLTAEADTPQDQINLKVDQDKADGSYDFTYASKVTGGLNHSKTSGTNSATTTVTGTDSSTATSTSDQKGHSLTQDAHDQQTGSFNKQILRQRQIALGELAESISKLHNGIYQNLFRKAKQAGLFLLVY